MDGNQRSCVGENPKCLRHEIKESRQSCRLQLWSPNDGRQNQRPRDTMDDSDDSDVPVAQKDLTDFFNASSGIILTVCSVDDAMVVDVAVLLMTE